MYIYIYFFNITHFEQKQKDVRYVQSVTKLRLEMGSLKEGHLFIRHQACSILGHTSVQVVSNLT